MTVFNLAGGRRHSDWPRALCHLNVKGYCPTVTLYNDFGMNQLRRLSSTQLYVRGFITIRIDRVVKVTDLPR